MVYVFDIDGTLSFNGVDIESDIVEAIDRLIEKGHEVIFASARPIRDMVEIVPEQFKDCVWIGGNGAFVKDDEGISAKSFDKENHDLILNYLKEHDSELMLDSKWNYTYKAKKEYPLFRNINTRIADNIDIDLHESLCKLVIFNPVERDFSFFNSLDVSIHIHSKENIIDISPGKCDKYETLRDMGVRIFRAFGNDANDVEMFKHAEYSYCVKASDYSIYADEVINESEVALYINKEADH